MKTKSTLFSFAVAMILSLSTAMAQPEPPVKILPSAQDGIFKVLYASETDQPVTISFMNNDGLMASDRIKSTKFKHGFFKKYDVTHVNDRIFWIEVKSSNLVVKYKMTKSNSGFFTPSLESTTYNHEVVAKNN